MLQPRWFYLQIVHYLQENPRLIDGENGKKIERVLDRLVEKMMKAHDTNEVRIHIMGILFKIMEMYEVPDPSLIDVGFWRIMRYIMRS